MLTWWQVGLAVLASTLGAALLGFGDWRAASRGRTRDEVTDGSKADRVEAAQRALMHHYRVAKLAAWGDEAAFWEAYTEAQEWHRQNAALLEDVASSAVRAGFRYALMHLEILTCGLRDRELRKENWNNLLACGAIIQRSLDQLASEGEE